MNQQYNPLHRIPNTPGFQLEVRDQSGTWHRTQVIRRDNGNHYLDLPPGVMWSQLVDWRGVVRQAIFCSLSGVHAITNGVEYYTVNPEGGYGRPQFLACVECLKKPENIKLLLGMEQRGFDVDYLLPDDMRGSLE